MGKKRLRGSGQHEPEAGTGSPGRRARVRNRLLVSVVLCAAAVVAAGAPAVLAASRAVSESQELVDRADASRRAISLAHVLADERDEVVRYLAAQRGTGDEPETPEPGFGEGLPGQETPGVPDGTTGEPGAQDGTGQDGAGQGGEAQDGDAQDPAEPGDQAQRSRVDRKAAELRDDVPAEVRRTLDALPVTRQEALAGDSGPLEAYAAYTATIQALGSLAEANTRALPARSSKVSTATADAETAAALPFLGRSVERASAARGLLLAALETGGSQPRMTAAAQQARAREQASLADFDDLSGDAARDSYSKTVNGNEVDTAERYLARLTDQPRLSTADQNLKQSRIESTLSARIDRMRGVQSSLATAELARLEQLRDEDVTALQLALVLLGACLLLAVGAGVHAARSMARPLAVVRLGAQRVAADPVGEEPVRYTGRNDEFADVVRAVNALRETAVRLDERAGSAETQAVRLAASKKTLNSERERLGQEKEALRERIDALNGAVHGTFVQLALRNLGLVERQLALIESLEQKEAEPEQLATLFRLDHMATRMRRHGENLLLLAGAEHAGGNHPGPVPLLDVLRAAVSEIERYERVELASLPPHAQVSGFAADDISHLVAELLDNATAFSPPDAEVQLSGWMLENGEVMLSVQDEGIGMTSERLAELNARLDDPTAQEPPSTEDDDALGMGLYVVARLAARHGVRVQLREQKQGGVTAVVVLPRALLPDRPSPAVAAPSAAKRQVTTLPGSVAEANSHTLPARSSRTAPATSDTPEADPSDTQPSADEPAAEGVTDAEPAAAAGSDSEAEGGVARETEAAEEAESAAAAESAEESESEPSVVADADAATTDQPEAQADTGERAGVVPAQPGARRVTDKGLPKRTPHLTAPPASEDQQRQGRAGGVNAEELRRRLGGFHQGAKDGHREVAAQLGTGPAPAAPAADDQHGRSDRNGHGETPVRDDTADTHTHDTHTHTHTHDTQDQQGKPGADDKDGSVEEARQ